MVPARSKEGISHNHEGQVDISGVLHREVIGNGLTHAGLIWSILGDTDTWAEDIWGTAVFICYLITL